MFIIPVNPLTTNVFHYIETSQMFNNENRLTGFYMMGEHCLLVNGLILMNLRPFKIGHASRVKEICCIKSEDKQNSEYSTNGITLFIVNYKKF